MANHGSKFVSVNLNKSYGQQHQPSHHGRYPHFNGGGSSYGQAAAAGRSRGGSGGGGGMLVLSRSRGGPAKAVSKLSVPPPLNLPSLRKEHEKFDISGSGGPGAGAGTGTGARPSSSGVGWTKPAAATAGMPEKNDTGVGVTGGDGMDSMDVATRATGSYMPPSARPSGVGVGPASEIQTFTTSAEKAVVLRGEDFPSLQAARPVSSGASQKHKELLKQKQVSGDELTQDKRDRNLGPVVDMNTPGHSSKIMGGNGLVEYGGEGHAVGSGRIADNFQKKENLPNPLPLVSVTPRSDWADDERDTGHGFMERGRDNGYLNPENYWDRDFDFPRPSVLPHKLPQNQYNRWGRRDNETGKNFSSEVLKIDPFNKDARASSREGRENSKWRSSTFSKDGFSAQGGGDYNNDVGARMGGHNNTMKESRYTPPHSGDIGRDANALLNRDSAYARRDSGLVGWQQQQQRNYSTEPLKNKGAERNSWDLHVTEHPNRPRGMDYQNNTVSKYSGTSGKMLSVADPILTMGRDKRFSKSDRHYSEDPFLSYGSTDFDEKGDIFSGGLVGVIKRKKDAAKPTDFHDPVRESFEAELERVQKMQELERQRIIEEQERAIEQARREEEERQRRIREEEERRRRLEEEAQEAAWRAEQERLEAIQRAEEQRIAREEEKKRIQLEEERRKQAARQKLQELEARMARRQEEASKGSSSVSKTILDENSESAMQEKHAYRNLDLETWEDGERMLENMTSGSFDSSAYNRSVEMSSKPYPPREGTSNTIERGKAINSWRREIFENGSSFPSPLPDQDIRPFNPTRGVFGGSRAPQHNEFHGGVPSSRPYLKPGMQEPYPDEFGYQKDHRWSFPGNADSFGKFKEMDSEFADKYGDRGWGQEFSPSGNHPPYPEQLYPHSEVNDLYSYGRSRYSMRQPRVLPPPLALAQRSGVIDRTDPSTLQDSSIHYTQSAMSESTRQTAYGGNNQGGHEASEIFGLEQDNGTSEELKLNNASRCDSQSSLSVSSPPTSPPHLSHDELDESGESPVISAAAEERISLIPPSVNHNDNSGNGAATVSSDSVSAIEDEEWALENDDRMQQQEEYDEDEDGYREEDELREGDEENLELNQKFDELELNKRDPPQLMDNVVLGFDEGVQVVIPSDSSEKNIVIQDRSYGVPASSTDAVEEKGPADGLPCDAQCVLPPDDTLGTGVNICSGPEKSALHGTIGQSANAPYSLAATDRLEPIDSSGGVGLNAQPTIMSSVGATSASGHTNLPSSSSGSQGDLPVKLQFGLFTGPSLIPSPVPAIQIGSIQMPLHIHPPIGPSITHMPQSQSPMFQFGQLHYTSPISQGILPIAPQAMAFTQPNASGHLDLNQNAGGSVTHEGARDASAQNVAHDKVPSGSMNNQPSVISASPKQSNGNLSQGRCTAVDTKIHKDNTAASSSSSGGTNVGKIKSDYSTQAEEKGHHHSDLKSYSVPLKARGLAQSMRQPVGGEKSLGGSCGVGQLSGGRGKRFAYVVKNPSMRPSFQGQDMPADPNGVFRRPRRFVQRTEFRIRENNDRKPPGLVSFNYSGIDDKSNNSMGKAVGAFARSGSKRGAVSNRTMKQSIETVPSASGNSNPREGSGDRIAKESAKKLTSRTQDTSQMNLRTTSEEDVDAPLQSGVVRVFQQPGIEAPSDEDDFIEVRSKRQMLNDRREQREKESQAKSRTTKPPRRQLRSTRPKDVVSRSHNKLYGPSSSEELRNSQLDFTKSESSPHTTNKEGSTGLNTTVSQPPIGPPAISSEQATKLNQPGPVSTFSNCNTEGDPAQTFDSKDKVVMSLSQTQFPDTMKPAQYDMHVSSVGGHSSTLSDPILPTSSSLPKDKSFSSGASTINSLLSGQKIQFGAVTSPTVLPGSRIVSNVIGSPAPAQSDVQMLHNFEKDSTLFFEKEKHLSDSCVPIQDSEAEAEAAASAVAVAAISSDEIVGNRLGSVNDTKSFGGADANATGVVGDQHLENQSRGEELLTVSLPADLSVETTPISLWPPLPSPQSSSSQMISHFPGGAPSHFPFYEMNPLLGGPIFAFSPQEESSGAQSQPQSQKTTPTNSAPLGNWPQSHTSMDSFYGPPAGYSGPFIGPPRGIPGVQGPPHMVVYNHFAPVGQYGQVGLSFMGATYIPSGKQTDWKNSPTTAAMPISEGDISNVKAANVQRNAPNMMGPTQQHLAPGSPLLPIPSPLPMFDVSPFQTAPDLSVQAHWGRIPPPLHHSVPVSRPLQPQVENALPSQVSRVHSIDQSLHANRFTDSRTPTPSDNGPSFSIPADKNVAPPPPELGLVDPLRSAPSSSAPTVPIQTSSGNPNPELGKTDTTENGKHQNTSSARSQFSQRNTSSRQGNTSGYRYSQRGGMSQRNNTGGEWSQRRLGFHGRNQGLPGSKMKQIYVAKQTTTVNPNPNT
ncbi:uncharacterized protein LOC127258477 [Andrographis paniculata]|uniref:uncharacterized protein LOC127258477 n=1 Tax=Andrographis paniculata TaxID=175694 RepID=UPI0021E8D035|nr:uncharacterized protein LOC127258477 [Andrographis paniculata]XP_051141283.1 uncharacterized protein LOC127258477 [Andrographis paniculata]XP_051141284.1 uncharacterized protein LOC127258477 [Andrographis paniculata]XP_051141285.1 uncharacterized protein LOC127258477 [Andrographis paniculata]